MAGDAEAALKAHLRCDSLKFVAAGREDMDVRMLGNGRPFVFECLNARCAPHEVGAGALEAAVSRPLFERGRIRVRCLQLLSDAQRGLLREGEAEKSKTYRAVVWMSRPISSQHFTAILARLAALSDIQLAQKTPVRVLHRRAPLTRTRTVHCVQARRVPGCPRTLVVDMRCAAGTYVKEFVGGDFGRTRPSLGELLRAAEAQETGAAAAPLECDCLQLDVRSIEMEWL